MPKKSDSQKVGGYSSSPSVTREQDVPATLSKPRFESPDLFATNAAKIGALFPEVLTEAWGADGKLRHVVDFEKLREILSGEIREGGEAYEFTWVGKKAAMLEAGKPIRKTLRPCVEESKNWDTTENLYIEGDNLEALKLLQESYLGKVKMIYIDPPYNTGNDFVYRDSFMMGEDAYEEGIEWRDIKGNMQLSESWKNLETNPRFHSDWCSMMYSD